MSRAARAEPTPLQMLQRAQRTLIKVADTDEFIPVFKSDLYELRLRLGGWERFHVELAGHAPCAAFITILPKEPEA